MIAPEKTKTNDEKYDKIEQYYSIKGYSFLHCDSDYSQIKRHLNIL